MYVPCASPSLEGAQAETEAQMPSHMSQFNESQQCRKRKLCLFYMLEI